MERLTSPGGTIVPYEKSGSGQPLVLVHGSFSNHCTNWECVEPILRERFTVYAIARRGRGETDRTTGHSLEDEVGDVISVIEHVGAPVFLLGHSYGAHCALAAAQWIPDRIRKLVLYEAGWTTIVLDGVFARLDALPAAGEWERFAVTFFRDALLVPVHELDALCATELWPPMSPMRGPRSRICARCADTTSIPSARAGWTSRCFSRPDRRVRAISTSPTHWQR